MKANSSADGLTLSDSPGCFWLFGGFFCVMGGGAVLVAVSASRGSIAFGQIILALGLGLAAIATGIYFIHDSPGSRVVIRRDAGSLEVIRRDLFRHQRNRYPLTSFASVHLAESKDMDGDPVFTITSKLTDGTEVPLTQLWVNNLPAMQRAVDLLSEFIPRGETKKV
jgi:hypothetical protein